MLRAEIFVIFLGVFIFGVRASGPNCPSPNLPAHASWDTTCTGPFSIGKNCTFDCLPPYDYSGASTITCQSSRQWTTSGTCVATTGFNGTVKGDITGTYTNGCQILQTFSILGTTIYTMYCLSPLPYLTTLTFYYSASSFYVTTTPPYTWSYGAINYASPTNATVVSIWIQQRSNIFVKGTNPTGQYALPLFTCPPNPSAPAHAVWDQPCNTTWGSKCTFNCLPPYSVNGTNQITCQLLGSWSTPGNCTASPFTGVKGDITGNYTNGCKVQSLATLGTGTYLLQCPSPLPGTAYISFYAGDSFTISADPSFGLTYGGVVYSSAGSSNVTAIWFQERSNSANKGTSATLVPVPRTLKLSKDHESCVNYPPTQPAQDYQKCEDPLLCLFRGNPPTPIGKVGQCWYPDCNVSYCAAGSKYMRSGYCHNLTAGGFECRSYLLAGATGCGGYTATGDALFPVCDPFHTFCINSTCVLSDCLISGCDYGNLCTLTGSTAVCSGQTIPGFTDPVTEAVLGAVVPALPPGNDITTQSYDGHKFTLEMMPRARDVSPRALHLQAPTACAPGSPCPPNTSCLSGLCCSPPASPCGPSPC